MSSAPAALPPLPASVKIGVGGGGLTVARVTGRAGSAEVYLRGAHVTSWNPSGNAPVLWMSAESRFTPGSPLRGGVPICFPWFGANSADPSAPSHGFARLADWELSAAREEGDDVVVEFRLTDSDATRNSAWPHRFEAVYSVTVGARLGLALSVTNNDTRDFSYEEALHTYLAIGDIRSIMLTGLEGAPFVDRLAGHDPQPAESQPVRFEAETDRIYLDTTAAITVGGAESRGITVTKAGSDSTVVWNPWIDKAAGMSDFGDSEWTQMVCVETCNIRSNAINLEPGETHTMSVWYDATE